MYRYVHTYVGMSNKRRIAPNISLKQHQWRKAVLYTEPGLQSKEQF